MKTEPLKHIAVKKFQLTFLSIFLYLLTTLPVLAETESAQIIEIISSTEVKTLGPTGRRQHLAITGIKPVDNNAPLNHSGKKRLKSLVLGKTVLLEKSPGNDVSVNYGGLDIAARLLEEGLVVIDEQSLQTMSPGKQQQYYSAQEQAARYGRGYWFKQNRQPVERYHYPQWPAPGLPMPMTNAPVFRPN